MRFDTILKPLHTFEVWLPTFIELPDGSLDATFHFDGVMRGTLVPMSQGLLTLVTPTQLDIDTEIRNLRDRKGNPVFLLGYDDDGEDIQYITFIANATPQMDPYGTVIAYRHNLKRSAREQ